MVLRKEITSLIKDLLKKNPQGLSITEIVRTTGINRNTAGRYLENLLVSGQVEMRRFGMAKIYGVSQRVPLSAVLSISSELVLQLDNNLRIVFINEPFLDLLGTEEKMILGKNIEYTPVNSVFDESFPRLLEKIQEGLNGKEASGDIFLPLKDLIFYFRIAPTVFEDGRKGVSVILEDITEQRRADNALRESEDRYRKLVEISPDAVLLHQEGKIIYANPATFRLLGASHSDEIIGKNVLDFIPDSFKGIVGKNIQKDLGGQTSPRVEISMIRVDGTSIMVEGSGIGTKIDGKPAVQVALRDITEQKRAEEALKIKERQLFSIYSNVPVVLFYLSIEPDNRFRFLTVNQSFLDKTHMSEDRVVGKYVHEVIPDPLFSRAREKYNQAIREKKTIQWEEVEDYPTGKRYGDCYITAVFDESGHPTNIIGSVHDSTKHKQLEEMLRESQARLQLILDSTDDIIIMQDLEGKFLYFNSVSRYGISEKETLGSSPYDFLDRETAERLVERVRNVAETGKSTSQETSFVWKGQTLWFSDSLSPVRDSNGAITAVVTVSHNITERKCMEMALRESEATARALLNAPTDSVILIDDQGIILALNEIAASRLGKNSDDLIGTLSYDHLPKEVAQRRRPLMAPLLEKKESVRFVDEREGRWYDTVSYPILNENGDVKKIAIIARDITEQKNIEKQIRESEQMYKHLLEQSFDAIAIHKEGKIAFLNEKAVKILGAASAEELIGRSIFDLIHPDSLKDLENRLQDLSSAKGKPVPILTEKFFRLDGTTVTVEVMAISFDDNSIPAVRVAFREIAPMAER
ncbi:MAG TPA: PAS domain S-box protein [Methanoregula sp.]|nr:PAS domain S-box protein [Methanoregula sp.]